MNNILKNTSGINQDHEKGHRETNYKEKRRDLAVGKENEYPQPSQLPIHYQWNKKSIRVKDKSINYLNRDTSVYNSMLITPFAPNKNTYHDMSNKNTTNSNTSFNYMHKDMITSSFNDYFIEYDSDKQWKKLDIHHCIPTLDTHHYNDSSSTPDTLTPSPMSSIKRESDISEYYEDIENDLNDSELNKQNKPLQKIHTHRMSVNTNTKTQGLFDALFTPTPSSPHQSVSPSSLKTHPKHAGSYPDTLSSKPTTKSMPNIKYSPNKLSVLFTKPPTDPQYVKYQTWSKNNTSNDSLLTQRLKEEEFVKSSFKRNNSSLKEKPSTKSWDSCNQNNESKIHVLKRVGSDKIRDTMPSIKSTKSMQLSQKDTPVMLSKRKSMGSAINQTHSNKVSNHLLPISPILSDNDLQLSNENGQIIARYKLGNSIGKGHFGSVYRALDLLSGKTVAIKQINLMDARKQDVTDMMEEAILLSSLTHPNIVKYEGFIQTHDHVNIVLEYVENGSLQNTLKSFGNSLPEHLVASYCSRILEGLAYLHQQDVVHCDLKAANILTTKCGDVKLSDFGVSLNLRLKGQEDTLVCGTPYWMSPEVIELKGASVQSDIWSLGCTIIELCTGKPPYADLITMTAMFRIVEDELPPLPTNISNDLTDFLKLCFRKNPEDRPKAKDLLYHPWINRQPHSPSLGKNTGSSEDPSVMNNQRINDAKDFSPASTINYHESNFLPALELLAECKPKSMFVSKLSERQGLMKRQSMSISTEEQQKHSHSLIDCSFPKGAGPCKECNLRIKREALVCKDFCGYICHKQCRNHMTHSNHLLDNQHRKIDFNQHNRSSLLGPNPIASVSYQLKERFSFSKMLSRPPTLMDNGIITPTHTNPIPLLGDIKSSTTKSRTLWWKKKTKAQEL